MFESSQQNEQCQKRVDSKNGSSPKHAHIIARKRNSARSELFDDSFLRGARGIYVFLARGAARDKLVFAQTVSTSALHLIVTYIGGSMTSF
jgi:hypothetical protein